MEDITVSFPGGKRVDAHYDGRTVKFDVVLVGENGRGHGQECPH